MAIEDFLTELLDTGSSGKRWKSWWAIFGLLVGAGLGAWLSYSFGEGTILGAAGAP